MKYFNKIKIHLIVGIVCFLTGKYVFQPKAEVKVKEVVKYVEKKQEDKKTNVITKIKETKNKDGTIVKDIVIVENSTNKTTSSTQSERKVRSETTSGENISIGILVLKDIPEFSSKTHIGVLTSIPIFGTMSVVGSLDTTKRIGLGISIGF